MSGLISTLFDIGRLPSKVVALVGVTCALILFAPERFRGSVHAQELVVRHGTWIGLAFIASTSLLVLNAAIWLASFTRRARAQSRRRARLLRELLELDPGQKALLREFAIQQRKTLSLPVDEPTVAGMLARGILAYASEVGERNIVGMTFPVTVATELETLITPSIVGLPSGAPTEAEIERIRSERPAFMQKVAELESMRSGW